MCGIAGFITGSLPGKDREVVVGRMVDAMIHRGPDDAGIASSDEATLGMRRLAIFDPANGRQPMVTPDRRFTLVFNGAIYNHRALRSELERRGHAFRTNCDTEVLLAAYAEWGEKCLDRLRGMYAFAAWDSRERTLFLARDPFGIKPLYYKATGPALLFASEVNALLRSGEARPEIEPQALAESLAWFSVPAPRTIYKDIRCLRPGELAIWREGNLTVRSYWDFGALTVGGAPPAVGSAKAGNREEFVAELRARLDDTIQAHVLADVPVGAFLSGGLDSAVIVGLMSRASRGRLKTFSIDFTEPGYSEASEAAHTAAHFGTDHTAATLTGPGIARDLESILGHMDQPTGDGINTYYASQAAHAGGVTVALSGLGGDELFGGYPSFRDVPRLARWLPAWRRMPNSFRSGVARALRKGDTRKRKLADFLSYARKPAEIASLQRRVFDEHLKRSLLDPAVVVAIGGGSAHHPALARLESQLGNAGLFELVSGWELRTYMADVLLRDSDVMSMRHSLELRVPFIDRPFIEWLWRQPAAFKHDPLSPKSVLARAAADILPPELQGRRKQGFTLPLAIWMKRDLKPFLDETFSDSSVAQSGFFSPLEVQRLWNGFVAGSDNREWSRIWSLAVLVNFVNRRAPAIRASQPAPVTVTGRRKSDQSRTLLITPEIFSSEGGIPRILQLYLKALSELPGTRSAVRLLSLNDTQMDSSDLRRCAGGEVEQWQVCSRNKTRFIQAALRMSRGCNRIVCGHVAQLPVAWAAKRLNPRLRYYLVAHGIEVWRPFSLLERIALRGVEKVFCVSAYTRRELLRNCPSTGRAVVLPNALDPVFEITNGRPLSQAAPVILVVTRLTFADRYKGVEDMIRAMPGIVAEIPEARLRIVGRGDDVVRLQKMCDDLGIRGSVDFLGFVKDAAMAGEYAACRLFALPSKKEGFGLVFLEAMARGRPCLGARAGGVPEVITPETGVLVDYGDVAGITRESVAALRRPWDEEAILERAKHFSFEAFRDRFAAYLAMEN